MSARVLFGHKVKALVLDVHHDLVRHFGVDGCDRGQWATTRTGRLRLPDPMLKLLSLPAGKGGTTLLRPETCPQ